MNKIYSAIVVLGLTLAGIAACNGCAAVQTPSRRAPLAEMQRLATVAVHMTCMTPRGELEQWGGTGIITGPWEVMTASHVAHCDGVGLLSLRGLDGKYISASLVHEDQKHDVAKLRPAVELPSWKWTWGPSPKDGEVICFESATPRRSRKCGKVSYTDGLAGAEVRTDASAIPGNSGSGVFNAGGQLVGILTRGCIVPGQAAPSCSRFASLDKHKEAFSRAQSTIAIP